MISEKLLNLMIEHDFTFWKWEIEGKRVSLNLLQFLEENISSTEELEQVKLGISSFFPTLSEEDIKKYAKSCYYASQMEQIRLGFTNIIGTRIKLIDLYCDPSFSSEQMEQIRLGIENKLNVPQLKELADVKLSANTMLEKRQVFETANKRAILMSHIQNLKETSGG